MASAVARIGASLVGGGAKGGGFFAGGIGKIIKSFGKSIITGLGFSAGDKILSSGVDAVSSGVKKLTGSKQEEEPEEEEEPAIAKVSQKNSTRNRKVAHQFTDKAKNHLPGVVRDVSNKRRPQVVEPEEEDGDEGDQ